MSLRCENNCANRLLSSLLHNGAGDVTVTQTLSVQFVVHCQKGVELNVDFTRRRGFNEEMLSSCIVGNVGSKIFRA